MPALSFPLRRGRDSRRQNRRTTRFALRCDPLENRQLLSVGQSGLATSLLASPTAVSAHLAVPAAVSNLNSPSSLNVEVDFQSFGGFYQIQIVFFGGGPFSSPTPAPSSGGTGFSPAPASGSSGGDSQSGLGLGSGTSSDASITPLNPSLTSITTTPGVPVFVVPPPIAPAAVHLGSSTLAGTGQSNSTLISNLDEQPPITHFGQGDIFESRQFFMEKLDVKTPSSSLIDFIEPFHAVAPDAAPAAQPAPQGDQAPAPDAAKNRPLPPISDPDIDAALDLTDARVLTRSRDSDASQPADELSHNNTSWSFSAIFGAATVVAGGYHLVLRDKDRFRGRAIPRWLGTERPAKRKMGSPSR